jgi:RimJ/RimL family protein N-acetyltransferase
MKKIINKQYYVLIKNRGKTKKWRVAMIVEKSDFRLKDGRTAIVRSPKEEDVQNMLDFLYKSAKETEFTARYPEEYSRYTLEKEKEILDRINSSDNEAMLVCFVEGRIAGSCMISWSSNLKTKHRARTTIVLLREFWNLGIGTRLLQQIIKIAQDNEDIIQIELEFVEGNNRARALYEKMGFKITGIKPNSIRLKDGTLLNEYSMIREIKR